MNASSLGEPEYQDKKARIRANLQNLDVIEGVLPTRPSLSPEIRDLMRSSMESAGTDIQMSETATAMREDPEWMAGEIDRAMVAEVSRLSGAPASGLLAGTPELREQLSAFASAGIGFFYASADMIEMPLADRAARGGNSAVTRVLNQSERILLETQALVVKFSEDATPNHIARLIERQGLIPVQEDEETGDLIFAVEGRTATEAALELLEYDEINFAEPDFIEHIGTRQPPPADQLERQWHHLVLKGHQAWRQTRGEGVNLVVIDNGFDVTHPDLADRLGNITGWYRSTPDLQQADFVRGTAGMPNRNHGTACAGMAAGRSSNGSGGLGVAYTSNLHVLACLTDQVGTQSTLARALGHAFLNGADIIACSLGPSSGANWQIRQVLREAIEAAARQGREGRGCPIFWATSNGNVPVSGDQVCSHPDVIAVGRSTRNDTDDGSAFGAQLEFLAPGVDVWIPAAGGGFHSTTGTSFAAPAAAGVGSLALSANPGLSAERLRELLRATCDKIGNLPYIEGRNVRFGFGRVNALKAVAQAPNWPIV
jgi:subtilisin family serine protease